MVSVSSPQPAQANSSAEWRRIHSRQDYRERLNLRRMSARHRLLLVCVLKGSRYEQR